MELLTNLGLGLQTAFTLTNLLYCLAGVFLGTLIGVLPGLGPTATIAMLLPITFGLPPVSALIMLAGHLLRFPVRRLDDGDTGQPAGRGSIGRHRARRLPDGEARTRRQSARHRGHRFVLRRHVSPPC